MNVYLPKQQMNSCNNPCEPDTSSSISSDRSDVSVGPNVYSTIALPPSIFAFDDSATVDGMDAFPPSALDGDCLMYSESDSLPISNTTTNMSTESTASIHGLDVKYGWIGVSSAVTQRSCCHFPFLTIM